MGLKNIATYLVLVLVLSVGAMVGLHGMEIRGLQADGARIETFAKRRAIASSLVLDLERYRRLSKDFRKLTDAEIDKAKAKLTGSLSSGVAKLEKLAPTPEEQKIETALDAKLAKFMELSAKIEPTIFIRDVFIREPARDLYEEIVADVTQLEKSAAAQVERAADVMEQPVPGASRTLIFAAICAIAMAGLLVLRGFLGYARPAARLRARALDLSHSPRNHNPGQRSLPGAFGEVERVVQELSSTVEVLRKERHQFVTAIAQDLRAPLVALQAGAGLLAEPSSHGGRATESERRAAGDVVGRSLFRLSSTLDDLSDIVEIERSDIRLDEKIVDVRGILAETSRRLGGAGASHEIRLQLPEMPVWAMIDPSRFERVIVHLMAKAMSFMPQGGRIDVSMLRPTRGSFRGLEITIQDAERLDHGRGAATGPEQELVRHWVSENGFGMALVAKVVRAHGGTVTASGVAGTGVLFTLRLPQERLGTGQVTSHQASPVALVQKRDAIAF